MESKIREIWSYSKHSYRMENVIRKANFSMESYSQEAMINCRHGIFICDNFYGITKVKTSMIYNALVQKSFVSSTSRNKFSKRLILVRKIGQKFISSQNRKKCSKDSKVRIFQYKFMNNDLY